MTSQIVIEMAFCNRVLLTFICVIWRFPKNFVPNIQIVLHVALCVRNSEFLERARLTDRCRRIESYHFRRKSRIIRPAFCQTDIPFVHFYKGRVLLQQLRTPTTTKRPLRFRSFTNSDVFFLVIQIFPTWWFFE